jgi:hypothetical protein
MRKIPNINVANKAILYNKNGKILGYTLDTPNAIAYAMANNTQIAYSLASYPLFGTTKHTRKELQDRFTYTKNEHDMYKLYLFINKN